MTESQANLSLKNVYPFMTEAYLKRWVLKDSYGKTKISIIKKIDLPNEVNISFESKEMQDKFIKDYNSNNFKDAIPLPNKITLEENVSNFEQIKEEKNKEDSDKLNKQIIFPKDYELYYCTEYINEAGKQGLLSMSEEQKDKINRIIKFLIGKLGNNLLQGKGILNISFPVFIFDKRTLHQVFAYEHGYAPYYLKKAAMTPSGIERLKWVTVFLVSLLHLSPIQSKPFNPILGETYQAKIADFNLYIEHVVNHPITANFYGFDDEGLFKVYGYQITDASLSPNSVSGLRLGRYLIEFKDRSKFIIRFPTCIVRGTTMGDRTFNCIDKMLAIDLNNHLCSYMICGPEEVGFFKSWFGKGTTSLPDTFHGSIVKSTDVTVDEQGADHKLKSGAKSLCKIEGGWVNDLRFDNVEYWNINDEKLIPLRECDFKCPSDGSYRQDLIKFIEDNEEESQKYKEEYEEKQRADRKLRKNYLDSLKKDQ